MRPFRSVAVALAVVVLAAAACSGGRDMAAPAPSRDRVLAIAWNDEGGDLVELEAMSLRPLTSPVGLGDYVGPWALSPSGSRLAVVGARAVHLIDLDRMQTIGEVEKPGLDVQAMVWADAHRLILASTPRSRKGVELAVLDVDLMRVSSRARVPGGHVSDASRANDALALLMTPARGIGPTRLLVYEAVGRVRAALLARIPSGAEVDEPAQGLRLDRFATPGLAVDEEEGRLLVVSPRDELVAEVDLESLDVFYHHPQPSVSLLDRLGNWIEPSAEAKGASAGSARRAWWLGNGRLAVVGFDDHASLDPDGNVVQRTTPSGLKLIDTEDWSVRTLDSNASAATVAGGTLIAFGSYYDWDSRRWVGAGLSGYSLEGDRRFYLFGRDPVWDVQAVGGKAYAAFDDSSRAVLVDLASGRLVRELDPDVTDSWPSLLRPARPSSSSR